MAKQILPVNFKDDILASSMGGKRRYNLIQNDDGTYSLEDVTDYTQTGSDFGAGQINATNKAVNESCDKANVIDSLDDIVANQADMKIAGAKAVAELIGNIKEQKILWSGSIYMQASQTVNLSEKISDQITGIILVWSRYDSGEGTREYAWNYTYIPKSDVLLHEGTGCVCLMSTTGTPPTIASKYVYISDDKITGHDQNKESPQNLYVLRRVIGV